MRTAPLAALTYKAVLRVENKSRRKAFWGGDSDDAGGKTSWLSGAGDAERSGGAGTGSVTSSSKSTGQGRLALDRSGSTWGDDAATAAFPEAADRAALKNMAEGPENKAQRTNNKKAIRIEKGMSTSLESTFSLTKERKPERERAGPSQKRFDWRTNRSDST